MASKGQLLQDDDIQKAAVDTPDISLQDTLNVENANPNEENDQEDSGSDLDDLFSGRIIRRIARMDPYDTSQARHYRKKLNRQRREEETASLENCDNSSPPSSPTSNSSSPKSSSQKKSPSTTEESKRKRLNENIQNSEKNSTLDSVEDTFELLPFLKILEDSSEGFEKVATYLNEQNIGFHQKKDVNVKNLKKGQILRETSESHIKKLENEIHSNKNAALVNIIHGALLIGYQEEKDGDVYLLEGNHRISAIKLCRELLMGDEKFLLKSIMEAKSEDQNEMEKQYPRQLAKILNVEQHKILKTIWKCCQLDDETFDEMHIFLSKITNAEVFKNICNAAVRRRKQVLEIIKKYDNNPNMKDITNALSKVTGKDWHLILKDRSAWDNEWSEKQHIEFIIDRQLKKTENFDELLLEVFLKSPLATPVSSPRYSNVIQRLQFLRKKYQEYVKRNPVPEVENERGVGTNEPPQKNPRQTQSERKCKSKKCKDFLESTKWKSLIESFSNEQKNIFSNCMLDFICEQCVKKSYVGE